MRAWIVVILTITGGDEELRAGSTDQPGVGPLMFTTIVVGEIAVPMLTHWSESGWTLVIGFCDPLLLR